MDYTIHPIATIHTDFADKFGIPRQSGLVPELTARIVFEPEYRDPNALVGIEGYDRLWLIWQFSTVAAEYAAGKSWRPTVRPPRLGGNVRMGNPPADGRAKWGVGIQDPDGAVLGLSDIVETLYLTGCSVVTSGDYQRYYVVDGQRYHHLIDPDTLMPDTDFRSVSIITEDSGYADLLSTAAFLMPYEESRAFIDSLDGVEAIWLFPDGSKKMTFGAMNVAKSCGATNQ